MLLVELLVATIQNVHLRVEESRVLLHVQIPVKLTQLRPELRCSLLAKFAVEDEDGSLLHQFSYVAAVLEERFLEQGRGVYVLRVLDVTSLVLIVPSAVDYDVGEALLLDELCKSGSVDRVHFWLESISKVHLFEELGFPGFLEKIVLNSKCITSFFIIVGILLFSFEEDDLVAVL